MESTSLVRKKTPEEREYEKKLAELEAIEAEVAERELEFATLRAELDAFSILYNDAVGSLIAELDALEAYIAEDEARKKPDDKAAQAHAEESRQRAQESADAMGYAREHEDEAKEFHPSDELKNLYRTAAKTFHPDLATEEAECLLRQRFMAEANDAYRRGDTERLSQLLQEWEACPESVRGNDTAAELIRTIRRIAQMEDRLERIEAELAELKESDICQMKIKVADAQTKGRDLLEEMATHLQQQIVIEKQRVELLKPEEE